MHSGCLRVRLAAPRAWAEQHTRTLEAAGLILDPAAATGLAVTAGRSALPSVGLEVDRWIVDSTPHLLVAAHPHGVEVGPWVLPGVSPCAHCVAASTLTPPPGNLPDVPRAWWSLAAGWIARDLAAWQGGESPSTWATSWLLGHEPVPPSRRWERHPYCGCPWFDL